jgi:hypothetical protein
MSLSKVKDISKIAVAYDKSDKKKIYYHETPGATQLVSEQCTFVPYHYGDQLVYVTGRRGSGKSFYANEYMKSYVKSTKNRVFLISRIEEDPSIQLPKRGMRIPINKLDEIDISDLSESLVVFDDIEDSRLTPRERVIIFGFLKDVMENSRHYNISALITSHMISNYAKTRTILSEMSSLVIFPQYSNKYQIQRVLRTYLGFNRKEINDILNKKSRWVQINLMPPKFILNQSDITLI